MQLNGENHNDAELEKLFVFQYYMFFLSRSELEEECGLVAKSLQKLGVLFFENANWKDFTLYEVHLFTTTEYEGEISESDGELYIMWSRISSELCSYLYVLLSIDTDIIFRIAEMIPKWFASEELPFEDMWPSTKYWLPKAIDGCLFDALFQYENEETLISVKVDEH